MDDRWFDDLTRALGRAASRRGALRGLVAGFAAVFGGATVAAAQRARLPNGAACARAADCASFRCADGICCDSACAGQCESCATGVCLPVTGAPDPGKPPCPGSGPCTAACDGVTRTFCAAYPGPGTPCGTSTCADGWQTTHACGGNGTCIPTVVKCAPFGCNAEGTACAAGCGGDGDCGPGSHCDDGVCRPNADLGVACDEDGDCAGGICADEVCCVERCGTCQVCNRPGTEGFCAPAPDGGACGAGGTCCGGDCVDTETDVAHCGACDRSCLGVEHGFATCEGGTCAFGCLDGFHACGETCCAEDEVCLPSGGCGSQEVVTFSTPVQTTWEVPAGVECAAFEVAGAAGGNASFGPGGFGGRLQATLRLPPSSTLTITVGGRGSNGSGVTGGAGGSGAGAGGAGGSTAGEFLGGGGGGGGTEVRLDGNRLLVAGGGGGGAPGNRGGVGGGLDGAPGGNLAEVDPGDGGTQSGPGSGGTPGGQDGAGPDGGDGGSESEANFDAFAGGGGGGGYYGGGGGARGNLVHPSSPVGQNGGGGGGGSGFISPDTSIVVAGEFLPAGQEGDGLVRITYPVACSIG